MNYDIKIRSDVPQSNGVEFDQLGAIVKSTKEIAQRALMLKLYGYSGFTIPAFWKDGMKIRLEKLSGNKTETEGAHLLLDADPLLPLLQHIPGNIFRPELADELSPLTPMALVITTFRAALVEGESQNNLDKPVLKALLGFKKGFSSDRETFYFSNRQSVPEVAVRLEDFQKIELLDEATPASQKVIVTGRLDEMKWSKGHLLLLTEDGPVPVRMKDATEATLDELKAFLGKEFTVQGLANYRPGGALSFVEMQSFGETSTADRYFSKSPSAMTAHQQLLFQVKKSGKRNPLLDIAGAWPGDESDEEFEQLLKDVG